MTPLTHGPWGSQGHRDTTWNGAARAGERLGALVMGTAFLCRKVTSSAKPWWWQLSALNQCR